MFKRGIRLVREDSLKILLGVVIFLLIFLFIFKASTIAPYKNLGSDQPQEITQLIPVINSQTIEGMSKTQLSTRSLNLPPAHVGLAASGQPQLVALQSYETAAGGAVANGMMIFTNVPDNVNSARSDAADFATTLKNFAKFNLTPVVVMEPTNSRGSIDFAAYKNGAYDSILNQYFQTLKNSGVTDSSIGMWVFFPEANLPEWGPVDVADFAPNVTRTVAIQKKVFPGAKASILLDAESYPAGSSDWGAGSYASLAPFVSDIPKGTLDSVGLQGFPWAPPANQSGDASYSPSVYLKSSLVAEAANIVDTPNVWLNTGTFAAMYTKSSQQTVRLGSAQRQAMLNGVIAQATSLKKSGFSVAINLFSEDKSNTSEAIDWSYKTAADVTVFNSFASQLIALGIPLWLFTG